MAYQLIDLGEQIAVTTVKAPHDFEKSAQGILAAGLPEDFARIVRTGIA
ncbi:MAG: hypothetical protein ACOX18_04795 [Bacillota bacterium]